MYEARHKAISRMEAECAALGGHGVVSARIEVGGFPAGGLEFKVIGTAVRADGAGQPPQLRKPFTSHLTGQDFAKLIMAGWVPVGFALGISVAARHDDWMTLNQTRWGAGNAEVAGHTDLVNQARHDGRVQLERDVARQGAEGVVVSCDGPAHPRPRVPHAGRPQGPHRRGDHHRHRDRPLRHPAAPAAARQPGHHVPRPAAPPGGQDPALAAVLRPPVLSAS